MAAHVGEFMALTGYLVCAIMALTILAMSYPVGMTAPDLVQTMQVPGSTPVYQPTNWWDSFIMAWSGNFSYYGGNEPLNTDWTLIIPQLMIWNVANTDIIPWWLNILAIKLPEIAMAVWVALAIRG